MRYCPAECRCGSCECDARWGEIQKGREPMTRKPNILAPFLIALLFLGTLAGCSGDAGTFSGKPKKDYSNIEMNPNIAIPGYESLEFKAGKEKQSVDFYNPDENTCFFRISLVLNEDTLWTSDYIEPGEHVKSIELSKELDSGDYPATLKYECFRLTDKTPLNGSDIELTLTVR